MENKRSIITCIFLIVRIDIDIQNILTSVQFEKLMILSKLNNNDIIFAITEKWRLLVTNNVSFLANNM